MVVAAMVAAVGEEVEAMEVEVMVAEDTDQALMDLTI